MLKSGKTRRISASAWTVLLAPVIFFAGAHAAQLPDSAALATRDVQVEVTAGQSAPTLTRISNPAGQQWRNQKSEALPANVEMDGKAVPVTWRLDAQKCIANAHQVSFVYEAAKAHLRLHWEWKARAPFGPVEHTITIENLGKSDVWLPMVDSLALDWQASSDASLINFYVEKGAGTPSAQGVHFDHVADGYQWTGKSSTYAHPGPGEAREIIPAEFVYSTAHPQDGWFSGIEFSGRTRISLARDGKDLKTVLGLDPDPGPFRTRVTPGGSFVTPAVFLGAFTGGPDGAGNQLRPWVRAVLGNPITWKDPHYPLTVNNSWGSGMDVDEKVALGMIADSKALGLEMFHMDAGWFRGVGDWYPNPKKFPHGLAFIADAAHEQGLRFGIWVDWTQAALDTAPGALNARDPKVRDWLVADIGPDWKPEPFKGQTIDLGVPAAREYCRRELERIIGTYKLNMLEHDGYLVAQGCTRADHPHAPPDLNTMKVKHDWGADFVTASNSTDVSYHAVRAYYRIYGQIRREHPGLLFEICNDGGRMVDFGSAAHGDYFSITDTYDPVSNRRAFFDASYVLPPAMLESYEEKWPAPRPENFLYMLRSGMMGWMTIMMDTTRWTPEQHQIAKQAITVYKTELRPLIRDARLYHISQRPDGVHWDGMEYWDPARGKGAVYAFRGTDPNESAHQFVLAGMESARHYKLHYQDGTAPDRVITGSELMGQGLEVHLPLPLSSELVFIQEVSSHDGGRGINAPSGR